MSILFVFEALHPAYSRSYLVYMKQGDELIVDATIEITICAHYFDYLLGIQMFMTCEVIRAHPEF